MQQTAKASTIRKVFSRETAISVEIKSDPETIWNLLTDATNYPRWNSTVISIDGKIALGEKIRLKSYLDPKRVFNLSVKEFEINKRLVWGDAMGKRAYMLESLGDGRTSFTMTEKIGGPIFPFFSRMIPPFDESFERFANDLKREAEVSARTN